MKKTLTLMLAFLAIGGSALAQTSREEARKIILGREGDRDGGNSSTRGRDIILGDGNENDRRTHPSSERRSGRNSSEINREYDRKIRSIRNNPNLSQAEKERIIRELERDRDRRLNRDDDRDRRYDKDRKYKSNRGKHKGWSKGRGNKHRDRDDDDDDDD